MPEETIQFQSGASIDTRTELERIKDYKFEEIVVSANPVEWVEKPESEWRKFPIFNQDGSGSCVAQTMAKLLGILYWLKNNIYVHFSATYIYQQRSNKPNGGMSGVEAFNIARNGVSLEVLVPSQNMSDSQMDTIEIEQYKKDVANVFKISNYVIVPTKDIDTVASIIQTTKKGVMLWFYFNNDGEWTAHPVVKDPNLNLLAPSTNRHSVAGVDFSLVNGKKCIIVDESWGNNAGSSGQRVIDEDFFKARNWFAAYPISFKFEQQEGSVDVSKPKHTFMAPFEFGSTSDDVVALQDILKYEGLFPSNISSSGYYGAITASALLKWQKKHTVANIEELDSLQGRRVGGKTIAALNAIYGQ